MSEPTTVTPYLCCRDASGAVEYYRKAFGAEPIRLIRLPNGQLLHAALDLHGATVMLGPEFPEHGALSPQSLGNSTVSLHLQVPDCDAVFARAVAAGCQVIMPLQEMFWGDRYGVIVDPFGHKWSIATTVRELTPEQMQQALTGAEGGCGQKSGSR